LAPGPTRFQSGANHDENSIFDDFDHHGDAAARGADMIDLVVPPRMALSMEGIACRPK